MKMKNKEEFKENDTVYYVDCNSCGVREGLFVSKLKDNSYQLKCYYPGDERNFWMDKIHYVTTKHIFKDYREAVLSISDVLREHKAEQEKEKRKQEQATREYNKPKCENCTHYKENKCFVFPDKELVVENNRIGCMYFKVAEI